MIDVGRRQAVLMSILAPIMAGSAKAQGEARLGATKESSYLSRMPASWSGSEKIGIVIYEQMTPLDVVGPHYFLGRMRGAQVQFVASDMRPVACENGLVIAPTATFDTCPKDLDVLMVGGGSRGTIAAMRDSRTIDFLADRGSRAKWVTSVCTGSLLLGQAGLLRGYRATSHWLFRSVLKDFGAIEVDERVVFDRNRATGAGVSAGIDLALTLVQKLRPLDFAQAVQLLAEYAPQPPLNSGTPDSAPPAVVDLVRGFVADYVDDAHRLARSARPAG